MSIILTMNDGLQVERDDLFGWILKFSGDNGYDLLTTSIPTANLCTSAALAVRVANHIVSKNDADYIQMTVTINTLEITMSTPSDAWWSITNKKMAEKLVKLSNFTLLLI